MLDLVGIGLFDYSVIIAQKKVPLEHLGTVWEVGLVKFPINAVY